jgi:hypothetical protein
VGFSSTGSTGQWCNGDAPLYYRDYGNLTFAECDCIANETGTQPYVGTSTAFGSTNGWLGDLAGANAAISDGGNWPNELVVSETSSYRCALAQVTQRTAPTVSPAENIYNDSLGRTWHYWQLNSQTVSQAMAFANARGARIISPDSVGRVGEGGFGTPPTHWCHANAMFNDGGNCNSDYICNFLVGYYEGGGGGGGATPFVNELWVGGYAYASIDDAPVGAGYGAWINTCQTDPRPLPAGWEIAPNDPGMQDIIYMGGWSTHCMLVAGGCTYGTFNYSYGNCYEPCGLMGSDGLGNFWATSCSRRVLIRRPL